MNTSGKNGGDRSGASNPMYGKNQTNLTKEVIRRAGINSGIRRRAAIVIMQGTQECRSCLGCGLVLPLTLEHFYRARNSLGFGGRCRACKASQDRTAWHLRAREARYGLTSSAYDDLLQGQGGGCAVCHRAPHEARMCVDHDHATGRIRGILCSRCNTGIAYLGDTSDLVLRAAIYLS